MQVNSFANASEVVIPDLWTKTYCDNQNPVITESDCAVHNYSVINHRLNYASGDTKGFQIPAGIYPVPTLPITVSASLKGAGVGVTTLKYVAASNPSADTAVLDVFTGGSDRILVSISDLSIDGYGSSVANNRGIGIKIKDTVNSHFANISMTNVKWGVIVRENNATLYIDGVSIKNVPALATHNMAGGMTIGQLGNPTDTQSNTDLHITNILVEGDFSGSNNATCDYGVVIRSGVSGVYGNRISAVKCDVGFSIVRDANAAAWIVPEWIFCTDCLADTNRLEGWYVKDARGVTLTGSWSGTSGGIGLKLENVSAATIQGMKIFNNDGDGVRVESGSQDVLLLGNLIEQNGLTAANANGIYTAGQRVITRNNIIRNTANIVVQKTTPQLTCGINRGSGGTVLGASTDDNIIQNAATPIC